MVIIVILLGLTGAAILALLIAAALSPGDYQVQAEVNISKPAATVYNYVKYLKNQASYNKWVMLDPNVRKEFKGTDGTAGFFYAWDSDNKQVGKGGQTITGLKENKRVDYDLHFIKPFEGQAQSYIEMTELRAGQTNVIWVFNGKRTFIMKVMHIVLNLKKMLTNDLTTSLHNLKAILEQQ